MFAKPLWITLASFLALSITTEARGADSAPPSTRELHLSPDVSAGALYELNPSDHFNFAAMRGKKIADAKGTIKVPKDNLFLVAAFSVSETPKILDQFPSDAIAGIRVKNMSTEDNIVGPISRLTGLRRLELAGAEMTDEGLAKIANLKNLEILSLSFCHIHGTCLKYFASMKNLRTLILCDNTLDSGSITYIAAMTGLAELDLGRTRLSDDGLEQICHLKNLRTLRLSRNSALTSKGFAYMAQLKKLETLYVPQTKVTASDLVNMKLSAIKYVLVPESFTTGNQLSELRKAYPKTIFDIERHHVDATTRDMFAPLH